MADEFYSWIKNDKTIETNDITESLHNLMSRKFDSELVLFKKCFEGTEYYFDKLIKEIEITVDEEK